MKIALPVRDDHVGMAMSSEPFFGKCKRNAEQIIASDIPGPECYLGPQPTPNQPVNLLLPQLHGLENMGESHSFDLAVSNPVIRVEERGVYVRAADADDPSRKVSRCVAVLDHPVIKACADFRRVIGELHFGFVAPANISVKAGL